MSLSSFTSFIQNRAVFVVAILLVAVNPVLAQGRPSGLPNSANGQAAIDALGDRLPAVAQRHGLSADRLRELFQRDGSLFVDESEALFYVDEAHEHAEPSEPAIGETGGYGDYGPQDAFLLHSKPGADRTIFLDFDGHLVDGTAWNSTLGSNFQAPPFDLDGNPGSFSDSERLRIIGIWRRVSEDFAPFDVNVTTQDPGAAALERSSSSDQVFGTRALISRSNALCGGSCGGVAYVGVYDRTGSYYQPAWVFFDNLGSGHEKYTAEAVSHEVGHNLGLHHDGTSSTTYYTGHGSGETGWSPIMGSGYYKNLSQWSKGEYPGANNSEDDYLVIQSNGLGFRVDDHGNELSTATELSQGSTFSITGILEQRSDVDFFRFYSGVGDVQINANAFTPGPNVDVELRVYNSSGAVIAQSNPSSTLSSALSFAAPYDGTYYVRIDGVGKGDPLAGGYTDYGCVGQYSLTGTVSSPSGNQPPVALAQGSPLTGTEPLTVSFDGLDSYDPDGSIVQYSWDFEGGTAADGAQVEHTFAAGSYTVTLTVTDDGGYSSSDTLTVAVESAPNVPPTASASASPSAGTAPLLVSFSSAGSSDSDGSITAFHWSFGDGGSSSSANPSHTYESEGVYTATLTVTDNEGASDSASVIITVDADPNYIAAPSSLSASVSGSTVTLSWSDNSDNEDGFNIWRGLESGKGKNKTVTWSLAGTAPADSVGFIDSALASGTYHYEVEAYNAAASAVSNRVKVNVSGDGGGGGGNGKGNGGKK